MLVEVESFTYASNTKNMVTNANQSHAEVPSRFCPTLRNRCLCDETSYRTNVERIFLNSNTLDTDAD